MSNTIKEYLAMALFMIAILPLIYWFAVELTN
jgi:hypothetical protein